MNGIAAETSLAIELLDGFAQRTGLSGAAAPRRYLWTDAFAVTGWLGLYTRTGDARFLELALALVDQVHHVLGRHRADAGIAGWISGLGEEEGAHHPTAGGLRIGKPLPERAADEPYDASAEWDRDGQYYHYLTRWMDALDRAWLATDDARYHRWAVELAAAANAAFIADGVMYWKMSVDLRRALVPSMGQHDPLDGLATTEALRASAPADAPDRLAEDAARLRALCRGRDWTTQDALGAGGLLLDVVQLLRLERAGRRLDVTGRALHDAVRSVGYAALSLDAAGDASYRLAFRELGLAIGIEAVLRTAREPSAADQELVEAAERHASVARTIVDFWSDPAHRAAATYAEHQDINDVMLAVALEPGGLAAGRAAERGGRKKAASR